jgi:hypothetical protein
METFLNLISNFPIQEMSTTATVLLKEQYTVKMSEGYQKYDDNACISMIFRYCPHPQIYQKKWSIFGKSAVK